MSEIVLDSSVLIAIFKDEPFQDFALDLIEGAVLSAVNLGEVLTKASDFGMKSSRRLSSLLALMDRIEPFSESQARRAGAMRESTRYAGLSLGDRACLALALEIGAEVYTTDRAWADIQVGCIIHLIR